MWLQFTWQRRRCTRWCLWGRRSAAVPIAPLTKSMTTVHGSYALSPPSAIKSTDFSFALQKHKHDDDNIMMMMIELVEVFPSFSLLFVNTAWKFQLRGRWRRVQIVCCISVRERVASGHSAPCCRHACEWKRFLSFCLNLRYQKKIPLGFNSEHIPAEKVVPLAFLTTDNRENLSATIAELNLSARKSSPGAAKTRGRKHERLQIWALQPQFPIDSLNSRCQERWEVSQRVDTLLNWCLNANKTESPSSLAYLFLGAVTAARIAG